MAAAARPGGLWRHQDFLLLWGGQTVSQVGSQVTILALPLVASVLLGCDLASLVVIGSVPVARAAGVLTLGSCARWRWRPAH
jgi:hypothetical protein